MGHAENVAAPGADRAAQPVSVSVARQPIFDAGNRRVAYELLYRATANATDAGRVSEDVMCSDTALHSVVSIGLDRLTGGAIAFVNVTREHLLADVWGLQMHVETRTVDTHIKRLREKLGAAGEYIHTVRGVGYRFASDPGDPGG